MKRNQFFCLLLAIALIASCKKNDAKTSSSTIDGTYKFQGLAAQTNSTVVGTDGEKLVSTLNYTSENNQGTIVFNNLRATSSGLQYSINTNETEYFYEDNMLEDSSSAPLSFSVPPSSSTSSYQLIGKDSIYFPAGGIVSMQGNDMGSNPGGGHYTISGNVLTLSMTGSKDSSFNMSGVDFNMVQSVVATIVLQKQ